MRNTSGAPSTTYLGYILRQYNNDISIRGYSFGDQNKFIVPTSTETGKQFNEIIKFSTEDKQTYKLMTGFRMPDIRSTVSN